MLKLPENLMLQHARFIEALCDDWLESGIITMKPEHTPRANAVLHIARNTRKEGDR